MDLTVHIVTEETFRQDLETFDSEISEQLLCTNYRLV